MKLLAPLMLATVLGVVAADVPGIVALPGKSPLVTLRIVFRTGSADDPVGRAGTASLTAAMLADAGTRTQTYKQLADEFFPMAAGVNWEVDKEMTTFSGTTHIDNLEKYYRLLKEMLLDPGWRAEDLSRNREDLLNSIRVGLRGNNDEELGKEALYQEIYRGTRYEDLNAGSVSGLSALTVKDLQAFYRTHYTRSDVTIGLAGGYPAGFEARVRRDFAALPKGAPAEPVVRVKVLASNRVLLVEKKTRAVAYSLGFPIEVRRGQPDFPALLVAQACLGQHRMSGRLFDRMRVERGLNYGDYAYIEYFPQGMFRFEPEPNLARRSQIFQIWIRPVEPDKAVFALRLALFELDKLVQDGLTIEEFERTRAFVAKNVNLLMKTKDAELGYDIDSLYYGIPAYDGYLKSSLQKLTREDVNRAIRRHLHSDRLFVVAVTDHAASLREKLLSGNPSPMRYNAPKPAALLEEDRLVERRPLQLRPENIRIVPVDQLFQ